MKYRKILSIFLSCIVFGAVFLQCTRCTPLDRSAVQGSISLVTYNAQTFFDAIEDGTEFPQFKGAKSQWTGQKYRTRLERLKQTVMTAGEKVTGIKNRLPDILVLQEIENSRVIEDFCKQLPAGQEYPYAVCPPLSKRAAFTTVLLSRYPIEHFFVHYVHTTQESSLRPLIETVINTGTADKPKRLTVFSVHWKSKSKSPESGAIRAVQEAQLVQKIQEHQQKNPAIPFLVCGDFNQPLEEFTEMQQFAVCWASPAYQEAVVQHSQPEGSYYFQNNWEKIDHIFYADGMERASIRPQSFFVLYEPPFIHEEKPQRYDIFTGEGYSDHLPLALSFSLGS